MRQDPNIHLDRCPHCSVAKPNLSQVCGAETRDSAQRSPRRWIGYSCRTCGGVLLTVARKTDGGWADIHKIWPSAQVVDDSVPDRAKQFLNQAINSIHAPSGAVMLAASSVDAMLKEIGLSQGNLYSRIKLAAEGHLITNEMAEWAHEVG